MIDFEINPDAIRIGTERVNQHNKLKAQLQVCLNGLVCPKCAKNLEKRIDGGRNIKHVCTSDSCDFVWLPDVPEKVKMYKPKKPPSENVDTKTISKTYSSPGIGAKITLSKLVKRLNKYS